MLNNEDNIWDYNIDFDNILGSRKEVEFSTFEENYIDENGTDHSVKLKNIGIKNEEDKNKNRNAIMWVLIAIILFQIIFISIIIFIMVIRKTYISDTAFKYFITGVFVNIVVLFKGIIKYLYSDNKSSLLEDVENKIKSKIN